MAAVPSVIALVAVRDAAPFVREAIESALAQEHPLDVVVVDDGSTDATPQIIAGLAAEHPGRIRLIRQANAGTAAATNTAIAAARGELLALLDADDVWPAGRLRRQVAELARRPDATLAYGDMTVIDAAGAVLQPSWLDAETPPEGHAFAALLAGNLATSSSIVLRAELARAVCPIPADVPFADWYLALQAARRGRLAYRPPAADALPLPRPQHVAGDGREVTRAGAAQVARPAALVPARRPARRGVARGAARRLASLRELRLRAGHRGRHAVRRHRAGERRRPRTRTGTGA